MIGAKNLSGPYISRFIEPIEPTYLKEKNVSGVAKKLRKTELISGRKGPQTPTEFKQIAKFLLCLQGETDGGMLYGKGCFRVMWEHEMA